MLQMRRPGFRENLPRVTQLEEADDDENPSLSGHQAHPLSAALRCPRPALPLPSPHKPSRLPRRPQQGLVPGLIPAVQLIHHHQVAFSAAQRQPQL